MHSLATESPAGRTARGGCLTGLHSVAILSTSATGGLLGPAKFLRVTILLTLIAAGHPDKVRDLTGDPPHIHSANLHEGVPDARGGIKHHSSVVGLSPPLFERPRELRSYPSEGPLLRVEVLASQALDYLLEGGVALHAIDSY